MDEANLICTDIMVFDWLDTYGLKDPDTITTTRTSIPSRRLVVYDEQRSELGQDSSGAPNICRSI